MDGYQKIIVQGCLLPKTFAGGKQSKKDDSRDEMENLCREKWKIFEKMDEKSKSDCDKTKVTVACRKKESVHQSHFSENCKDYENYLKRAAQSIAVL